MISDLDLIKDVKDAWAAVDAALDDIEAETDENTQGECLEAIWTTCDLSKPWEGLEPSYSVPADGPSASPTGYWGSRFYSSYQVDIWRRTTYDYQGPFYIGSTYPWGGGNFGSAENLEVEIQTYYGLYLNPDVSYRYRECANILAYGAVLCNKLIWKLEAGDLPAAALP